MRQTVPVTSSAIEDYLARVEDVDAGDLRALDAAIRAARPDLEAAVKYGILMYTLDGDWRHWVCAINAQRQGVCLRFLYGVLLDDPLGVLRKGSAQLMTWDVRRGEEVDAEAVAGYVREAADRHDHYRANAAEIGAAAKATPARPARRNRRA